MGAALDREGFNARVGEDDLVEVFRGGITFVGGFNIGMEKATKFGKVVEKLADEIMRLLGETCLLYTSQSPRD